ncbi:hypothetical protein [Schlesneria paludicola]|uniref:hypothetical protein n=1 Tax=Schlesneria paludicola TaxID=360056 RepID=UPI00029A3D71|nr:hypothetical protein [Schlesneria paludicola]
MFRVGLRLLFAGLLVQGLLLASISAFETESDWSSFEQESEDSDEEFSESSDDPQFIQPALQVESVFAEDENTDFSHDLSVPKRGFRFWKKHRFLQQVSQEVPLSPTPIDGSFMPGEIEQLPMDMEHPPLQFGDTPCDSCEPVFGIIKQNCCHEVENWSPVAQFFGIGRNRSANVCSDVGIGHERVVFAPFEIDASQPTNFTMVRWDSGFGLQTPSRSEYFWSKPGKGPTTLSNSINYQELRFITEAGSSVFSVQTEIPVRFIDDPNGNSASGIGDMKIATKARLINGKRWQVTQIFRTYINIGSAKTGAGAGHLSLEPGLLTRYEINPSTYVHGQVKLWIPIAADVDFASNVLNYGVGISHVLYETNNFAVIPDLELVNYGFLGGQKTVNGLSVSASGETAINLVQGVRFVIGPKGDLGLFEFGISNTIGMGNQYVNDMVRLDFKFTY